MVWVPARAIAGAALLTASTLEKSFNSTTTTTPFPAIEEPSEVPDLWGVRGLISVPDLSWLPFVGAWMEAEEPELIGTTSTPEEPSGWESWKAFLWDLMVQRVLPIWDLCKVYAQQYCGPLCSSILFAVRWTYWLMVGIVGVFLLQLGVWTYTWVVFPIVVHSRALVRYFRGDAPWSEVSRLLGERPFRPNWKGPCAGEPWSVAYVQSEVRGRGLNRLPHDLLITDGTAIARLRHGTVRGRTNRHGFICACDEVKASSHRYFRNLIEASECRIHLCAHQPCTAEGEPAIHVGTSAVVPQVQELDLQDLAGRGPWARSPRRGSRPGAEGAGPRHEGSETESEAEEGNTCQADQVGMDLGTPNAKPLATEPCRDLARHQPEPLLKADEIVSCQEGLKKLIDGTHAVALCDYHRAIYQASLKGRTCSVEGCLQTPYHTKGGVKLCRLHGAKEERKPKTSPEPKPVDPSVTSGVQLPQESDSGPAPPSILLPNASQLLPGVVQRMVSGETLDEALDGAYRDHSAVPLTGSRALQTLEDLRVEARRCLDGSQPGSNPDVLQVLRLICGDSQALPDRTPDMKQLLQMPHNAYSSDGKGNVPWGVSPPEPDPAGPRDPGDEVPRTVAFTDFSRATPPGPGSSSSLAPAFLQTPALPAARYGGPFPLGPVPGAGTPDNAMGVEGDLVQGLMRRKQASPASTAVRPPDWYRAGAYTAPPPAFADEATKALQAIAKAVTSKDEAASQERGKLSSIGKVEERCLYLVRGCDSLTVPLGEATVGKELFHALRNTATQDRPLLRSLKFPINITNRFAFGVSGLCVGGKGNIPEYSLTTGDFPATSEAEFDSYSVPGDIKLEKKPRAPATLTLWYRNALRQCWALACIFGVQHYGGWERAASSLLRMAEETAHAWPLHLIISTWDELWSRFMEEVRDIERKVRREMGEEAPSFERLKFFCTAPGVDGNPWLRLPQTFELEDPLEYFQTDVLPRQRRILERTCWQLALKGPQAGLAGGRAGEQGDTGQRTDTVPGPKVGANTSAPALLGKPLSNKEVQRSMDHRPKCQRTGKYFCWDAMSRRGCHAQSCSHSHEKPIPGWNSLDFSVQMQLLRRGGHLGQPKMSGAADVDKAVAALRKAQADKVSAAVAEGKAAKAKAKAAAAAAKPDGPNPPELGNFFATDLESGLAEAMAGSALDWTANHSSPPLRTVSLQQSTEATRKREADMASVESSGLVPDVPPTLACYLRNRLLHIQGPPGPQHVQQALDDAVLKGAPELAVEAEAFLAKVGDSQATRATLTRTSWVASSDAPGSAQLSWGPYAWDVLDYGDTLAVPAELEGILEPRDEPHPDCEPRQCLLLHVAAACLWAQAHVSPSWSEVRAAAAPLRVELHGLACQAAEALSFEPGSMTRAERDLRVFIHDLLYHGHDKDYRCLAAFPPSAASHLAIQVVRLDSWKRPTVERLAGASAPLNSPPLVWLLVHEGHMRLLVPTSDAMPAPARSITMHGWDVHLEAASVAGAELVPPAKCPRCDAEELRRTGVSTSVLGLYPVVVPTERAGSVCWESSPPSGPAVDPLPVVPLGRGQAPWSVLELALGTPSALAASVPPDASWGTIGLAAGQDLAAAVVRQGLLATLRAHQPPLLVVSVLSPELTAGYRLQPGCSGLSSSLLSFVALLLQEQRSRAGDVLFLHPLTGAGWRHESILTALQGCPRVRLPLASPGRAPLLVATTASAAAESLRTGGTLSTAARVGRAKEEPEGCFGPGDLPTPLRKGPLAPPLADAVRSAAAAYLDAVEEAAQFSKEGLRSVAAAGSLLLRAAGGWQEAMRAIKRTYIQRHGDHFDGLHGPTLDGLVPPPLLERARHVAVWGVEAHVPLKESSRLKCAPHPSLKAHMDEAAAQLWKDVVRGRVLVCYDQGEGLDGVISVPMARVPKMNPDRTVSDKGRVVWDATPVNRFCSKEDFPPALQPKHREVARVILYWGLKFPGVPILLSKKDVSDAFKWLPVALEDTKFFAASYVEADHDATLLYGYMTFGWRGAPGEYMGFAWVLKAGHEAHGPSNGRWEASDVAFHSFVLMDDTVLVEPDIGLRPWVSVEVAEQMTRAALGPRAINPEKDAVEGALETRKLIWGLTYDTGRGTVSLPIVKIEKAYHLLHLPQFDHGNRVVPLRLVQELRGNQQFWLAVFPSLAPYLGATNDLLGPPDDAGNARPKGPDTEATWQRFWEAIELQRVLVDSQGTWEARFSHSLLGALTLPEYLSFPGLQDQVVWASGDATTQVVGAIDWEARVAVVEPVKDLWAALREFLSSSYLEREDLEKSEGRFGPGRATGSSSQEGDEGSFSPGPASEEGEEDVMISLAELLAVLCLVAARWRAWSGKVVVYAGDNQNVVRWIAAREASPPAARFLLQILGAAEAVGHFRLYAEYIRTYHNVVADDLTRKNVPDVLRENNLKRIEGRGTMVELLDRSWANRALLWATMEDDDRGIALQLCLRRSPPGPPTSVTGPLPLRIHEMALGPPVYTRELTKEGAVCTHQQRLGTEWSGPTAPTAPAGKPDVLCWSLGRGGSQVPLADVLRFDPECIVVDSLQSTGLKSLRKGLGDGWFSQLDLFSGRSFGDQVWWRRWALVAVRKDGSRKHPPKLSPDEEPVTLPLARYNLEWRAPDSKAPPETWKPGPLKLDSSLPYLRNATPKPSGRLGESLVWDPTKPLPALHDGSWDPSSPQPLLLLGSNPQGVGVRTLLPEEACSLLGGRRELLPRLDPQEAAKQLLEATPPSFAQGIGRWLRSLGSEDCFSPGPEEALGHRAGVCSLPWEEHTRRALMAWMEERDSSWRTRVGGDSKGVRGADGGNLISEEGWVPVTSLVSALRQEPAATELEIDLALLQRLEHTNSKSRFVLRQADPLPGEDEGAWYAAAWAGHTLSGVVGPGAIATPPPILLHGTYRSKVPPIQLNGLLPLRRALHLQDPSCKSGRWRSDLEVAVTVDAVKAAQAGCIFRLTGNGIWLTSQPIPTSAILSYAPWTAKVEAHSKGLWQGSEQRLREETQGEAEGRFAPGQPEGTPKGSSSSQEGQPPGKESREDDPSRDTKGEATQGPRLDLKAYQGGRPSPKEPTLLKDVAAAAVALGATLEDGQEVIVDADTWQVAVPEAPEFEADVDFGRSTSESGSEEATANAAEVAHTYSGEWSTPDGLKCLLCNAWIDGGHLMTPIHNRRMRWHLKERARQNAAALSTQLKDLTLETPAKKQRQQSAPPAAAEPSSTRAGDSGPKLPLLLVLLTLQGVNPHWSPKSGVPPEPETEERGLGEGGLGAAPPRAGSARGSTESLPATGNQERQGEAERGTEDRFGPGAPEAVPPGGSGAPSDRAPSATGNQERQGEAERGTEDRFGPGAPEAVPPDSSGAPSERAPSFEEQMAALDEEERILLLEAGGGLPSESSSASRPLVPRTGIRLTAPKVGLLRAISDADTRNWKSLSAALKEAAGEGGTKAQLLLDLERLATQRGDASREVKGLLEEKVRNLKALETSDAAYLKELDSQGEAMRELERQNPVRPSLASKPLSSDRLTAAIKAGTPIWVARKQEKGRLRAQEHRARIEAEAARERAERPPGAEPTPTGEALDERMKEAARLELREFRALLAQEGTRQAKRPPDSTRRRKLKKKQRKERLREKARNDDADRDTNHAIAHARDRTRNSEQTLPRSEGRFGPGRSEGGALTPFMGGSARGVAGLGESGRAEAYLWETGLFEGFLLGVVACLWAQFCWRRARGGSYGAAGQEEDRKHDDLLHTARKPYGGKVEVKFLRDEAVFHAPSCNLVRPLHKAAQPCRDCGPEARWGYLADLGPRNHDNATRDTNHAYAHLMLIGVTFFLLGLLGSCLWGQPGFPGVTHKAPEQGGSEECFIPGPLLTQCENEREDEARCGAKAQRRVTFQKMEEEPSYEELAGPVKNKKEPPFLGGPSSAKRLYGSKPPQLALPLATREAFEAEALRVAMDRLTTTTQKAYQGQLKWWRLFCLRRGIPWLLSGSEPSEEETHLLDFLLHTAINGARAPGTLKMRLAAIKSAHVSLGLKDPLEGKPRLLLVLAGFKKRYATPTRRLPVTPTMLAYLFTQLWENAPHEAPGLWLALCLGYFFLLRASEFLPVPYLPDSRHLKGTDLRLRKGGQECDLKDLHSADEVVITLRGSKTDKFNRGTTRNHFRGVPPLCPVDAAIRFFSTFPARHGNGEESGEPLLRGVTRECLQMLIAKAAEHQGMQGATGAHSLRFGGASAIWAAYQNSAQLQRFGRWASDVYHGYIWDARASSKGVAKAMAEVDLIPP
ncbi:kptA [Symbiodinium sp. CCMP2592]|nr:kptA [Symbiodinium sp. CCMP2592]